MNAEWVMATEAATSILRAGGLNAWLGYHNKIINEHTSGGRFLFL